MAVNQESFPVILREGLQGVDDPDSQKLFLCAAVTVMSGLCLRTTGIYRQRQLYPNLYLLVIAPAGAGKGSMTEAAAIVDKIDTEVHAQSLQRLEEFKQARRNKSEASENLIRPVMKEVMIAGNTSGAMLLQQIYHNGSDTPSIIHETEMDVFTAASRTEWGNLSASLRQGYHNETMRVARKGDGGQIQIRLPKLAICFSGTPDQFFRLIPSAEDGLFSRFMVLNFQGGREWQDVQPCDSCVNRSEVLNVLSELGYNFFQWAKLKDRKVNLTSTQWEKLNAFGSENLSISVSESMGADAIIKRHGSMVFKMAMTITMLRAYESLDEALELTCTDSDFEIALEVIRDSYSNALDLLEHFPAQKVVRNVSEEFYNILPESFTTQQALQVGRPLKPERSLQRYLSRFVQQGLIEREGHGQYKKRVMV